MFLVYKHIVSGGAETLFLRVGKYMRSANEPVTVLCKSISEAMYKQYKKNGLQVEIADAWTAEHLAEIIQSQKAILYGVADFILISKILENKKISNHCLLYIVHKDTLKIFSRKFPFLNTYIKKAMSSAICELQKSYHLAFMDAMCIEECENYYKIKFDKAKKNILYLPFNIVSVNEEKKEKNNNITNILSVLRAEFPFKGYICGLIKDLGELDEPFNLCIISYGNDIDELKKWVSDAACYSNLSIKLVGETSYEELDDYYESCDLYVGMGTTILEAASRKKICIPVDSYTYDFRASGFFHDNPQLLTSDKNKCKNGIDIIKTYLNKNPEERCADQELGYKALIELYSVEHFCETVNSIKFKDFKLDIPFLIKKMLVRRMKF